MRTEKCEVFISGSSAKMLSTEIATQMRGRSLSWELFPFSFQEFLEFKNISPGPATSRSRHILQKYFNEYWECGGFPEVLNVSIATRIKIHQEYFKTILQRDIIQRFDALHPQAVMEIGHRLLGSVGSFYSINRITDYLKSLGYKVSKEFVGNCIQWFEDAYFLFSVKIYDSSISRRNANPKKVYSIDHALVRSVVPAITKDNGHLLESLVYVHLKKQTDDIFYYRTTRGNEVDFAIIDVKNSKSLIQVCYSLEKSETRNREVSSLREAMAELHIRQGTIVTFEEDDILQQNDMTIKIVSAKNYLLADTI